MTIRLRGHHELSARIENRGTEGTEGSEGHRRHRRHRWSALIAHRDGIVGSWASGGTGWDSAEIPRTVPGELKRWDPRIRRFLFESELLSSLYFAADIAPGGASGTQQWATLWSLNETGGATGQNAPAGTWSKFVSMNRPTHSILQQQLNLVNGYSDLRADRAREICG
jgi:hypothetical protein